MVGILINFHSVNEEVDFKKLSGLPSITWIVLHRTGILMWLVRMIQCPQLVRNGSGSMILLYETYEMVVVHDFSMVFNQA